MNSTIALTTALLIGAPTIAQSQIVQSIEGRASTTNSIINTNSLNGQKSKGKGMYDYSNVPDCTRADKNNGLLGSMIITKVAEGQQGGLEITGFHENFSCFLTGINNLKVGHIIIGILGTPVRTPADVSKILNTVNLGNQIPIVLYDKDWQTIEIFIEVKKDR